MHGTSQLKSKVPRTHGSSGDEEFIETVVEVPEEEEEEVLLEVSNLFNIRRAIKKAEEIEKIIGLVSFNSDNQSIRENIPRNGDTVAECQYINAWDIIVFVHTE